MMITSNFAVPEKEWQVCQHQQGGLNETPASQNRIAAMSSRAPGFGYGRNLDSNGLLPKNWTIQNERILLR